MKSKMNIRQIGKAGILTGLLSLGVFGCGSSSSNDQGVGFTFMGWFAEINEDGELEPLVVQCGENPPQISDFTIPLSVAFGEGYYSSGAFPTGELALWAGGLNNLQGQTVRMDSIFLTYNIPGALSQPPDTASALGQILGPPPVSEDNAPLIPDNSTLPIDPGNTPLCNQGYDFTPLIPTSIKEWMNFHRDEIPEAPFRIVVTGQLSGVTSSGDRLYSNELAFGVTVTPDNVITPAVGGNGDSDEDSEDASGIDEDDSTTDDGDEEEDEDEATDSPTPSPSAEATATPVDAIDEAGDTVEGNV